MASLASCRLSSSWFCLIESNGFHTVEGGWSRVYVGCPGALVAMTCKHWLHLSSKGCRSWLGVLSWAAPSSYCRPFSSPLALCSLVVGVLPFLPAPAYCLFLLCPLLVFLNPAYTFVRSPFIKNTLNYLDFNFFDWRVPSLCCQSLEWYKHELEKPTDTQREEQYVTARGKVGAEG